MKNMIECSVEKILEDKNVKKFKSLKFACNIMVLLAFVILLMGCNSMENKQLDIGIMSDLGAVPIVIAKEKGFFEREKIDVNLEVFRSAVDRDSALQTNNLDGAMADMLTIFFYREVGYDMKMVSNTYGNYKLVSSPNLTSEEFMTVEKKQVGLSSNTVIDFATSVVADEMGFTDTLDKVAIPQMPVRLEMLGSNELSGATLPEPLATNAMIDGGELIGDTEGQGLYPAIMIFSQMSIDEKTKEIESFFIAYNEAVDYLNATNASEYYDILVEELGFSESLEGIFEIPEFEHIDVPDQKTFDVAQTWMQEAELIENEYEYEAISQLNLLPNR
jgi:NitT/TauT family transport system substrate-binding protein